MIIYVSELASVMGVDNPERSFKGVHAVKDGDEERMTKFIVAISSNNSERGAVISELGQKYLPTILRARVEGKHGKKPGTCMAWEKVAEFVHLVPAYFRFVRDHPYAPTYYKWLVTSFAKSLPWSWVDMKRVDRPGGFVSFSSAAQSIRATILAAAATPSPNDLIFPNVLSPHIETVTTKLNSIIQGWRDAGMPEVVGWDLPLFMADAEMVVAALGKKISVQASLTVKQSCPASASVEVDPSRPGEHWASCDVSVEASAPAIRRKSGREELRACARCKSVRYCSEAHQKLAWPTHRRECFAPKW